MKPLTMVSCLCAFLILGCEKTRPAAEPASGQEPVIETPGAQPAEEPAPPEPPLVPAPTEYVAAVDHPYLPLVPGTAWSYAGEEDGIPRREEIRVLDEPEIVFGVACTAVVDRSFLDGELRETTTQWLAQDASGNVWRFGEETVEIVGGLPVVSEDSWEAGVDGALPGMVLAADPRVGDVYIVNRPDGGIDVATVLSLGTSEAVPAGVFQGCMEIEESNPEDPEDKDRILYAPGVGVVSESSASGSVELVSYGVR